MRPEPGRHPRSGAIAPALGLILLGLMGAGTTPDSPPSASADPLRSAPKDEPESQPSAEESPPALPDEPESRPSAEESHPAQPGPSPPTGKAGTPLVPGQVIQPI